MKQKRFLIACVLLSILIAGCGGSGVLPGDETSPSRAPEAETQPPETIPVINPDFGPEDVRHKNTYTGEGSADTVVATMEGAQLTLGQLACWYWGEAVRYCRDNPQDAPDLSAPMESQSCTMPGVNNWQQYFLLRALDAWHTAQAMDKKSQDTPLEFEPEYEPDPEKHEKYLTDIPATRVLYGNSDRYQINSLHQNYLDELPRLLEELAGEKGYGSPEELASRAFGASLEELTAYARLNNLGYMYLTFLSYGIDPTEEDVKLFLEENGDSLSGDGDCVDIRLMLLVPDGRIPRDSSTPYGQDNMGPEVTVGSDGVVHCTEEQWAFCESQAQDVLKGLGSQYGRLPETVFAEQAHASSQDAGTALDGGRLDRVTRGQLLPELDAWCFDESRQSGDTAVIRTDYGCVAVFLADRYSARYAQAEDLCAVQAGQNILEEAKNTYPMEVRFDAVVLPTAEGTVGAEDILYPDIAHERFPEVPLYLQQDYPKVTFGTDPIRTHGCGITSMAMLASYMTDQELTPPEMCRRYGRYGSSQGTDGMIFIREPPAMGFYLLSRCYEPAQVLEALEQGHIAISVQTQGYWTRAGHYIVLEKLNDDGTVQVRDSNLYNYNNSWRPAEAGHLMDKHAWKDITAASLGYWIFDYKITRIPVCSRCGDTESPLLSQDYLCRKCRPAMLRQEIWAQ